MKRAPIAALLIVVACNTIESRRRSTAPLNASADFPCDQYADTPVKAVPRDGRCVIDTSVPYDFTIVVHVPESSFYAAAHTFVLTSSTTPSLNDLEVSGPGGERRAKLPVIGLVTGAYTVTREVASAVLDPNTLVEGTSIPVRAVYVPLGREKRPDYDPSLPLDVLFASSVVDDTHIPRLSFLRSVPLGRWRRSFSPEPPWQEFFPPFVGNYDVSRAGDQVDNVTVGGADGTLDDPGGLSRVATITRAEGLDDWTVFLRDKATGVRVSTLKTICGKTDAVCERSPTRPTDCCVDARTEARKRLDTIGLGISLDSVEAVLAPPAGWVGVPTLVDDNLLGVGISLPYKPLRPPVALEGIVATSEEAGVFLSVTSRVTLESQSITPADGVAYSLLHYATTVSTDDRGRFATVVPPGTYRVTVEPLEGTRFAAYRQVVEISDNRQITLSPPRKTRVKGAVLLSDGRPAGRAELLAAAAPDADPNAQPLPRPARTPVLDDGTFELDLDQGAYVLTVVPEDGTGFPRVVTRTNIPADQADVGVIRIPPPTRLGLQIVDPTTVARPIPFANVRIFASPVGGAGPLLEIGSGLTNADGRVEILLPQQPK